MRSESRNVASGTGSAGSPAVPAASSFRWSYAIDGSMPAARAVAVILKTLLEVVVDNEQGVIERRNEEFLHDYRVAIRRTRSALSLFGETLPPVMLRKGRRLFKDLGNRTNEARDLDVLLLELAGYAQELAPAERSGLGDLERRIALDNRRQYSKLRRWLGGKTHRRAVADWRSELARLAASRLGGPMAGHACEAIRNAASRAYRRSKEVSRNDPDAAIHRLRIRFKKLRYALEFSRSLTPGGEVDDFIGALKLLQDDLGVYQDLVVHARRIAEFVLQGADDPDLAVSGSRLVARIRDRQARLRKGIQADIVAFCDDSPSELERVLAALGER